MQHKKINSELDNKLAAFWLGKPRNFYNAYDYALFWKKRKYEDQADQLAVRRLMKKISLPHLQIIDIGGGLGRMTHLYEKDWDHAILLDPSITQLNLAKKNVLHANKVEFIEGSVEEIPLSRASCDTALCIRTFHYVEDYHGALKEIRRVLMPHGYLILEIPNKVHIKARIISLFSRNSISSRESISRSKQDHDILFLNHHPSAIRDELFNEWFEIIEMLSVSNFRSTFFKKVIPLPILLFLEKILQRPLALIWFGPSIYFLARKRDME